ncbi:polymerase [Polychytrium aggregatum]|uniref:polymerase n=1 Tax=Polychytrium aggregatum TaxID=110093 RepID=UPI0022FEEF70|nr:polymerase [Polychytrium aggregatum]KAI9206106.1 polymerase [Polychytrium aggregatum]
MSSLGVTQPISLAYPTAEDQHSTTLLVETLKNLGQYESEQEAQHREVVLGKLNILFKEFIKKTMLKKNMSESMANEVGGKIFTFGSFRLGVHGKGADIDTLCVAPKHIQREEFFEDMYEMLKAHPEVTELTRVQDAYVPVVTFVFDGIQIDLLFARLALSRVEDDLDLSNDNLLRNLDERCVRSLNGSRVTDEILRLVPNIENFRTALRCIKLWAKRKAIYSNVMGFFGGVAWAMVVARVCQLYPNAAASVIVAKFFRIMHQWKWPQPVLLKPISDGPLNVRVWNPKLYPQDKAHRMPVITPAYPSMCSTHNVMSSTQRIMTREFELAAEIVDKINHKNGVWNDLFAKHQFFYTYRHYLQIVVTSDDPETQLTWSGLVESKIRQLNSKLELAEGIKIAHPFIKGFERQAYYTSKEERDQLVHGKVLERTPEEQAELINRHKQQQEKTDQQVEQRVSVLHSTLFYMGLGVMGKEEASSAVGKGTAAGGVRRIDVSYPTSEFCKMVRSWDRFSKEHMAITIQPLKASQLPSDVFEEGELPAKLIKKRTKTHNALENPPKKLKTEDGSNYCDPTVDATSAADANGTRGGSKDHSRESKSVDTGNTAASSNVSESDRSEPGALAPKSYSRVAAEGIVSNGAHFTMASNAAQPTESSGGPAQNVATKPAGSGSTIPNGSSRPAQTYAAVSQTAQSSPLNQIVNAKRSLPEIKVKLGTSKGGAGSTSSASGRAN